MESLLDFLSLSCVWNKRRTLEYTRQPVCRAAHVKEHTTKNDRQREACRGPNLGHTTKCARFDPQQNKDTGIKNVTGPPPAHHRSTLLTCSLRSSRCGTSIIAPLDIHTVVVGGGAEATVECCPSPLCTIAKPSREVGVRTHVTRIHTVADKIDTVTTRRSRSNHRRGPCHRSCRRRHPRPRRGGRGGGGCATHVHNGEEAAPAGRTRNRRRLRQRRGRRGHRCQRGVNLEALLIVLARP